jgi:lipid II:glycine glycyltransferase (peptidoglycan interpeptide bridge formation enzyme)
MNLLKDKYIQFCQQEKEIPIFSQPWWLDAVCSEKNWDIILIEKGDEIVASFPFYIADGERFGFKHISMPNLTQKLGPYIKYPDKQTFSSKLSFEKEIMEQIIDKLPQHDSFTMHFDYKYTNWLPFYWKGFQQTTRYTYLIDDLSNSDDVFESFSGNKKTNIRKAFKKVQIKYDLACEDFIKYYSNCLAKLGDNLNYPAEIIRNLYDRAYNQQKGRIIYAVGIDNPLEIHGAIFFVWDSLSVYSIVTSFDTEFRNSASSSLLFYQIMKDFQNSGLKFDFEGSMVEPIERSYNKFGTKQIPYNRIFKTNSRRYKIYSLLSELKNEFRN